MRVTGRLVWRREWSRREGEKREIDEKMDKQEEEEME